MRMKDFLWENFFLGSFENDHFTHFDENYDFSKKLFSQPIIQKFKKILFGKLRASS